MGVYLIGVYPTGVYLMGVSLTGVHAPHKCASHRPASHVYLIGVYLELQHVMAPSIAPAEAVVKVYVALPPSNQRPLLRVSDQ
jgi:hypothetical protein